MRSTQGRWINTVGVIRGFISRHAQRLARTATSGAWHALDAVGHQMEEEATRQVATAQAMRVGVVREKELRDELFAHLARIVAAARLISRSEPMVSGITLPLRGTCLSRLVSETEGIVAAVAPVSAALVAVGLPVDFAEALQGVIADLQLVALATRKHRGARITATSALALHEVLARTLLRVVDLLVRLDLERDSTLLAEWDGVMDIARRRGGEAQRHLQR